MFNKKIFYKLLNRDENDFFISNGNYPKNVCFNPAICHKKQYIKIFQKCFFIWIKIQTNKSLRN